MDLAERLIASFGRIASADGGELRLIAADAQHIRLGYRSGADAGCESGACMLPPAELQEMMRGWLARVAPDMRLSVEPIGG